MQQAIYLFLIAQQDYKQILQVRSMRLGQQVLDKISNLLVEIDRPKSPKRKVKKQKQFQPQPKFNNDDRLYQNYKILKQKAYDRQKQKVRQQLQRMQPFRVDNKHSMFLNSRKNYKPIHERTADIIRQKQLSIQKKRTQIQQQRQRKKLEMQNAQQQDDQNYMNTRSKSQRRIATRQQIDQMMKRLNQRQKQRMQKANRQKMDYLKQKLLNNKQKPIMNKKSQRIWQKMKVQKQLSDNVFQRFQKYTWDHKKQQQNYINKIKQKQTPFKPQISKNSIQILNKSTSSRLSLTRDLDRTHSCKCFSKHGRSQQPSQKSSRQNHMLTPTNSSMHIKSQINLSPNR